MIIKRLTMKNFGVYAGVNTFEFSHKKPIVLIGGMNGRGKTTFLEAILLALYGENSAAFKESRFRSYGQYLRSYVNKGSIDRKSFIELDFVMSESGSDEYFIRREWDSASKKTSEVITVKENGKKNDFLTENWMMFVENILPSALSSFYFFDGEKIAELAADNTNEQMNDSIRSMLGIKVLDVLKNDLNRSLRRTVKSRKDIGSYDEVLKAQEEKENLEAKLRDEDQKAEEAEILIQEKEQKIRQLHQEYELKGGDILKHKKDLMQQRANLLAEKEKNAAELVELAAGEAPLLLVSDLLGSVKLNAEDEHNEAIMAEAMVQIEELLSEYAKTNSEAVEPNRAFLSYVKKHVSDNSVDPIYELSDHALFQLNSLIEAVLKESKQKILTSLRCKNAINEQINDVESYLTLDINEARMKKLQASIKKEEEELLTLKMKLAESEAVRMSMGRELTIKSQEHSCLVEEYLQHAEAVDDTDRMIRYSNIALSIVAEYTTELQKRKTGVLAETITKCYKKLANKKNLIDQIIMDSKTLNIVYLDQEGHEVQKSSLSAGEKQLMVISILWALAICSRKKLPVIIDTPLSRLDSAHRTSLVESYFPYASDQTIILSTDSEIDHNYYNQMKEFIGDEFTLKYDEETRSTTIMKGYFQKL